MFDKKVWSKEYSQKNRERINANKRLWRAKYPDKVREENAKRKPTWLFPEYKAKKRIYDKERRNSLRFGGNYYKVLERDGHKCVKCGATNELLVHHIDGNGRTSQCPNNDINNLQTLCQNCHTILHQTIFAWSEKYSACRNCLKSDKPHYSQGYCQSCYWLYIAKPKR